jgi:crotonobetainyl-CoA:carnitine CoA-transferase CaiB-like acyl-CoA transferase
VFPCAGDQAWAVVCVRNDDEWRGLVDAMGNPTWAADGKFATGASRLRHRADVNGKVGEWTATLSPREVMARAQEHGVPAGAMLSSFDQLSDPHFEARGFLVPVQQQEAGPLTFEGPAFRGSTMTGPRITQAPRLGEHTNEIARSLLGLTDTEIEKLIADGVLEIPRQT